MGFALRVQDLWKEYRIGGPVQSDTFYELLSGFLRAPHAALARRFRNRLGEERFWALREVGFDVAPGEVVGIIGRNGAGKSTLLKVLSRISEPTRGRVEIRGRLSSLLEVGTGFHPELTGRENIFLNGAILGMRRREIERKLDEIVAFAEVDRFLETPVKRYSSGMYVRLAFAVAAHLEPETLVVDEVLAVGDVSFQKKCLEKMGQVGSQGRTVLFVSHNMSAISRLCKRSICLEGGKIVKEGATPEVIAHYLGGGLGDGGSWEVTADSERRWLRRVRVLDAQGSPCPMVRFDEPFDVELEYVAPAADSGYTVALKVTNFLGIDVFSTSDLDSLPARGAVEGQLVRERCHVEAGLLRPGSYVLTPMILRGRFSLDGVEEAALQLEVSAVGFPFEATRWGVVTPRLDWSVVGVGAPEETVERSQPNVPKSNGRAPATLP